MAKATTDEVANWFIRLAHELGDPITNLKLQKLVYYAQAWHLGLYGEPLIPDAFEAWVHGPAIPSLCERFSQYKWNPISDEVPAPSLAQEVEDHLREVDEAYGGRSCWDLERMTHSEEPWLAARGALDPDAECQTPISEELMMHYYALRAAA